MTNNLIYPRIKEINLEELPAGQIHKLWLHIVTDGMGRAIDIPVMVAKGSKPGPTLGLTAAIHGNEINGISIIQRVFQQLNIDELNGTIVGVPVANAISLLRNERRFPDGTDLNHIMPGKPNGTVSQVYAHRLFHRVVQHFDYLVDLHTASFGRINSFYIRADMGHDVTRQMALVQNPDIIVHNPPSDGTLRGAAEEAGIHAITLELGDPNKFQRDMITAGYTGILNLMSILDMVTDKIIEPDIPPIICKESYWIYTNTGGVLRVFPDVVDRVDRGQKIATLSNIFGDPLETYNAPENGIIIGKETYPIAQTGERVLHLGIME